MRGAYAADDPWQGYRQKFRVFFREARSNEGWCSIHQVPMKDTTKNGHTWRSHRTADGQWCKGK
jgi:hypothetical protein